MNKVTQRLGYFLFGVLCLSDVSKYLSEDILRLPFVVPEMLWPAFILLFYRRVVATVLPVLFRPSVLLQLSLWAVIVPSLYWIGLRQDAGTPYYLLSTARGYLTMGLFAIIGKEFEESDSEFLFCVCAGSLIGTWACKDR